MLLLVSVRNASEAAAAMSGGADVIDAKEPEAGALGPVGLVTFREIHAAVGAAWPVSAAIGDAADEEAVERDARAFAAAGADFIKIGIAGISNARRARSLLAAAARGSTAAIAVAYADATDAISRDALIDVAADAGMRGVLLDTSDKRNPPLRDLIEDAALAAWVARAHACGLLAAVAGRLRIDDLPMVHGSGADIAGVRGAACTGGRGGAISPELVQQLRARCHGAGLLIPDP